MKINFYIIKKDKQHYSNTRMTNLQLFQELFMQGFLDPLKNRGFLNNKIYKHYKYYLHFEKINKSNNINRSVLLTAEKFDVNERTVWRAIKTFNK
jgi:hypothetical protein